MTHDDWRLEYIAERDLERAAETRARVDGQNIDALYDLQGQTRKLCRQIAKFPATSDKLRSVKTMIRGEARSADIFAQQGISAHTPQERNALLLFAERLFAKADGMFEVLKKITRDA